MRTMLRGKIHRATVTDANVDYEGSITIDAELLERADILPHEQVDVWNVSNGERFTTYTMTGPRLSGTITVNGAAAHRASEGDLIIIAAFTQVPDDRARGWTPRAVFVNEKNRIVEVRGERVGVGTRGGRY